jgi:ribosomal protein S18 acetylase RimI-like enzyme
MGVAEALARDVQRRAVEDGAPVLAFHTADFMHSARALYDRLGFQRVPRFDSALGDYLGITLDKPVRTFAYARRFARVAEGREAGLGHPAETHQKDLAS